MYITHTRACISDIELELTRNGKGRYYYCRRRSRSRGKRAASSAADDDEGFPASIRAILSVALRALHDDACVSRFCPTRQSGGGRPASRSHHLREEYLVLVDRSWCARVCLCGDTTPRVHTCIYIHAQNSAIIGQVRFIIIIFFFF